MAKTAKERLRLKSLLIDPGPEPEPEQYRLNYDTVPIRNIIPSPDGSGRYDCELNHPIYGWIPFTADPADEWEFARPIFHRILAQRGA